MNKFNFCIAALWPNSNQLKIYTFHREVHWGDQDCAEQLLDYVKTQCPDEDWKIVKVTI